MEMNVQIELDGVNVFFDVVGPQLMPVGDEMVERPTLLILHGGPGFDHSTLRPYFDRFADTHQVVYLDHRGCGRSIAAPESWRLDQWSDDVAAFCNKLGIERPLIFGHSFGGMVAMHTAVRYPKLAAKLILSSTAAQFLLKEAVDVATKLGGERAGQIARDFFSAPTVEGYELYAEVCLPLYNQKTADEGGAFRNRAIQRPEVTVHFFSNEMMDMDLRPDIGDITCPTLVLGGAEDPVTPARCSQEIAKAIGTNARLEIFADCGHGVHRDNPKQAEKVIREFLAYTEPSSKPHDD